DEPPGETLDAWKSGSAALLEMRQGSGAGAADFICGLLPREPSRNPASIQCGVQLDRVEAKNLVGRHLGQMLVLVDFAARYETLGRTPQPAQHLEYAVAFCDCFGAKASHSRLRDRMTSGSAVDLQVNFEHCLFPRETSGLALLVNGGVERGEIEDGQHSLRIADLARPVSRRD